MKSWPSLDLPWVAPHVVAMDLDFSGDEIERYSRNILLGEVGGTGQARLRAARVLVVGAGNSACDIAADICPVTASCTMAARSPVLMMPRMFLGVPTARVLARVEKPWMPWPLRRRIRELISRMAHGRMEQWGFTTPRTRTHPAGHHLLMAQFVWGRVGAKPGIASVHGTTVRFTDGSAADYDTMIAATGYEVDLPFLDAGASPVRGHWLDLYRRVVRPGHPGLYFAGFFNVTGGGNIRMMDDQAAWIAALETGAAGLPGAAAMQAAGVGVKVSEADYADPQLAAAATKKSHFGSWREALEAAGLDYDSIRRYREWDDDRIIEMVRAFHRDGKELNAKNMELEDITLITAARRRFDSWHKALTAAGLDYTEIVHRAPFKRGLGRGQSKRAAVAK